MNDRPSKPFDFSQFKDHRISDGEILNSMGVSAKPVTPPHVKPVNIAEIGFFVVNCAVRNDGKGQYLVSEMLDQTNPDKIGAGGLMSEPMSTDPEQREKDVHAFFQAIGKQLAFAAVRFMKEIDLQPE